MERRTVAYCRNSGYRQAKEGTIEVQQQAIQDWLDRNPGHVFVGWYLDEGKSGALPFEQRPRAKQLLEDAAARQFDVLLVYKLDRTARDEDGLIWPTIRAFMRKCNVEIIGVTEGWSTADENSDLHTGVLNLIAAMERRNILRRTADGKIKAARDGKWASGSKPFGYTINKDGYLEVVEDEAEVVRLIFDLFTKGMLSPRQIAEELNARGVPTIVQRRGINVKTKGVWWRPPIVDILSRREYMGEGEFAFKFLDEPVAIPVPAIIDKEQWFEAQRLIAWRYRPHPNARHLLAGLIHCGHCGRTFVTVYGGNVRGTYRYYRCSSGTNSVPRALRPESPCTPFVRGDILEEWVWSRIVEWVQNPQEAAQHLLAEEGDMAERLAALRLRLNEIDGELASLAVAKQKASTAYLEGDFDIEIFRYHQSRIDQGQEKLKEEKARLQSEQEALHTREARRDEAERVLAELRDKVLAADEATKRKVVHILVEEVVVHRNLSGGTRVEVTFVIPRQKDIITLGAPERGSSEDAETGSGDLTALPGSGPRRERD